MTGKIRVVVLFGGRSAEHEVSVISARSMLAAMDRERYEPSWWGLQRTGAGGWRKRENRYEARSGVGGWCSGSCPDYLGLREIVAKDLKRWGVDVVFPLCMDLTAKTVPW